MANSLGTLSRKMINPNPKSENNFFGEGDLTLIDPVSSPPRVGEERGESGPAKMSALTQPLSAWGEGILGLPASIIFGLG